jgi:outer membrane autotransporter protein
MASCVGAALVGCTIAAHAQGLIADINGRPTGDVTAPLTGTWQQYSYTFTATRATTFVTFLFKNVPGATSLDDIAVVHQGSSSNLLQNGNLAIAGGPSPSTLNTATLPAGWHAIGPSSGLLAGGWLGPADGVAQGNPPLGSHSAGTGLWLGGNTVAHDGITQAVATTSGRYVLTFWLGSDSLPDGTTVDSQIDTGGIPDGYLLFITPIPFATLSPTETANQRAIGRALDALAPAAASGLNDAATTLLYPLYTAPVAALPAAFNQLAPTIYGAGMMAARGAWYQMADSVGDRLAQRRYGTATANTAPGPGGSTVWVNGIGQFTDVGTHGAPGYHTSVGGVIAGVDMQVAPGATAGASIGGGSVQTSSNGNTDSGTAVQITLYGGLQSGLFFVDGQGAFMHVDQTERRNLSLWSVSTRGDGGLKGGGVQFDGGVHLAHDRWQFEPTLTVSTISLNSPALTESAGGALAESIGSQSITSVQSMASLRVGTELAVSPTIPVQVHALVGWQHEFLDTTARTAASLPLVGAGPFPVSPATISRDAARLGAGFDVAMSPSLSLYGSYQAALGQDATAHYVMAGLRLGW